MAGRRLLRTRGSAPGIGAQRSEPPCGRFGHKVTIPVDAVLLKGERPGSASKRHADEVARAVSLDMVDYFTPTAANFFGRINGAGIQAAICEAKGGGLPAPGWAKLKKAELATLAERQVAGTGWLPAPLRIEDEEDAVAGDTEDGDDSADSDEVPEAAE